MQTKISMLLISLILLGASAATAAGTDANEVQALAKQVSALNDEVERLKKAIVSLQATQPTVTTIMPNIAERFHVMHYAGEAEDWAVASHELMAIQHLLDVIVVVDPAKGAMANGFMSESFEQIDAAIDHENMKAFDKALAGAVEKCNGCHVAAGSPSMKITLNARDSLSMRHSHDLGKSEKPGEHTHKHE